MNKEEIGLVLHAPNIHVGGGLELLRELVSTPNLSVRWGQLDERIKNTLLFPRSVTQHYIKRSIFSRLLAEWRLWRNVLASDVVLCFHGLPPLFPLSGRVVVFIQNRILVEQSTSLAGYRLRTKIRLLTERFWLRTMHRHASRYIVQTPPMAIALRKLIGNKAEICCIPFVVSSTLSTTASVTNTERKFDFLYVASGEAHKNHARLLEAWHLLAEVGLKPSLALTVDPLSYSAVSDDISRISNEYSLDIINMGQLSPECIAGLYQSSSALIYPSKNESFGLPLIEAMSHGLPILASELDYVRDVVIPVETFNPDSSVSIARAVKRFLGNTEPTVKIHSTEKFLSEVLR